MENNVTDLENSTNNLNGKRGGKQKKFYPPRAIFKRGSGVDRVSYTQIAQHAVQNTLLIINSKKKNQKKNYQYMY